MRATVWSSATEAWNVAPDDRGREACAAEYEDGVLWASADEQWYARADELSDEADAAWHERWERRSMEELGLNPNSLSDCEAHDGYCDALAEEQVMYEVALEEEMGWWISPDVFRASQREADRAAHVHVHRARRARPRAVIAPCRRGPSRARRSARVTRSARGAPARPADPDEPPERRLSRASRGRSRVKARA